MRSFYFYQMQDYEETKKPELFHINFSLFVLFPFNPTPPFKNTEYKTNYRIFAIVKKKIILSTSTNSRDFKSQPQF